MTKREYPAVGETLYESVLPNGLTVRVVPKPGYRRTSAVFAVNYGGADRRFTLDGSAVDTPAGVAHYLEHKMFDTPDGDALMTLTAAGADPNAFTSMAMTAYHFDCTGRLDENLRTLLSFVSVPYFTQESVDKERGIIAQEIRMYEDSPEFQVYERFMRCICPEGSPLRDDVTGTVESIQSITPALLYDCHRAFYRPSNMALTVVGDADPARVEDAALSLLPGERAEAPARDYGDTDDLAPAGTFTETRMEVAAPLFLFGCRVAAPPRGEAYLRERVTAGLALRCLCGRSSPFYIDGYASGLLNATFSFDVEQAAGQRIAAFEGETSRDPRKVMDALTAALRRVEADGFDEALFERQKRASLGGRVRALGNFHGLAVGLAEAAFAGYVPLDAFSVLGDITCAEASDWAVRHLRPERFALSIINPKEV